MNILHFPHTLRTSTEHENLLTRSLKLNVCIMANYFLMHFRFEIIKTTFLPLPKQFVAQQWEWEVKRKKCMYGVELKFYAVFENISFNTTAEQLQAVLRKSFECIISCFTNGSEYLHNRTKLCHQTVV